MCGSVEDILFNIYCWFINIELTANSIITHAWTKLMEHMDFLCKAYHSLLVLRKSGEHFISALRGHFKWWNHQKKKKSTKIWETWHYIYHQKDICLQDKNWNKKVEHHLVFLLFEYQVTQKSHCCIYICDWPWKCHEYWFWCYKYILVSKWIPIMESINNEDQLFSWPLNDVGVGPVDTPCVTFSPL